MEMNDPAFRPAITGKLKGMDQYDLVFAGFPVWWYSAPMAVFSFLEENNLIGKKAVLLPDYKYIMPYGLGRFCRFAVTMLNFVGDTAYARDFEESDKIRV